MEVRIISKAIKNRSGHYNKIKCYPEKPVQFIRINHWGFYYIMHH